MVVYFVFDIFPKGLRRDDPLNKICKSLSSKERRIQKKGSLEGNLQLQ